MASIDVDREPARHIVEAPEWALHLQPCGALLVDRSTLYYLRVSGRAARLALQIARTGSVEGAARVESALSGVALPTVLEEMRQALRAHPLTAPWEEGVLGSLIRVTGASDAFLPLQCSLQLTNSCNLRCAHCYASSGRAYPKELATNEWMRVMERLAAHGVAAVTLTGGEPTIARDFSEILCVASSLFRSVDVFTNGLSWSDAHVDLAGALGNVRVQVSIDGGPDHHDRLRGRSGSYTAALDTIRRLVAPGVPVLVAMSVTPENWDDVGTLIHDASQAGAVSFRAGRTLPVGRADHGSFGLTPEQTDAVAAQLAAATATSGMHVVGWDACSDTDDELRQTGLPVDFCTPGYLTWHIRADGGVTPCQIEVATFGHILDETMSEIGSPERLRRVCAAAQSCRCLKKVELPPEVDEPFAPASPQRPRVSRRS